MSCVNPSEVRGQKFPMWIFSLPFCIWLPHTFHIIMFSNNKYKNAFPQTSLHNEKNHHLTSQSAEVEWFLGSTDQGSHFFVSLYLSQCNASFLVW